MGTAPGGVQETTEQEKTGVAHLETGRAYRRHQSLQIPQTDPFKFSVSSSTHREWASFSHLAALGQSPQVFQYRGMPESRDHRVTRTERWREAWRAVRKNPCPTQKRKGQSSLSFLRTTDIWVWEGPDPDGLRRLLGRQPGGDAGPARCGAKPTSSLSRHRNVPQLCLTPALLPHPEQV